MARRRVTTQPEPLRLIDVGGHDSVGVGEPAGGQIVVGEPFDAFYRREFPRLVVLAHGLAGQALAFDLAQEAMIVAYRRWDEVQNFDSASGWVRGVCAHTAVSAVRRRLAEARAIARLRARPAFHQAEGDADEEFWREVRRLPRRQAQVVGLHYALDMSVADVAAALGCAEGSVKAQLFKARRTLAARLAPDDEEWQ
jgi:RNA polymerase sigma-70 factor (ECF subfamily)